VIVLKAVAVYGLLGGVLIAVLTLTQYRFLVLERSVEIYGGLIAAIFAGLGIWLGLTLTRAPEPAAAAREPGPPPPSFAVDEEKLRELGITPRELEILQLIARGMSTREIAAALFVSENTVKTHASRLFSKLGVNRRIQAVETARALRLIPGHPNG
jgi:DNA-binding CsgD family transcriptional regulator